MSKFIIERFYPSLPVTERAYKFHLRTNHTGEWLIYPVVNTVVVRNLRDSVKSFSVLYHKKKVTNAVFSPNGMYVASTDEEGNIKIWCPEHEDKIIKYEYRPSSSFVQDIAWTGDGLRIAICGTNSDSPLLAFSWDTGNRVGDFHKSIENHFTLDVKKNRPYGLVVCDTRGLVRHYTGVPYQQDKQIHAEPHTIYCVRISPDEKSFAICNTGGMIHIYNERTMELEGSLVDKSLKSSTVRAHEGGVYGICWSPDSQKILSSSADKSCKIWDATTKQLLHHIVMGNKVEHQQLGCAWTAGEDQKLLSISYQGFIQLMSPQGVLSDQIIEGHQLQLKVACSAPRKALGDKSLEKIYTGCCSGRVCELDLTTGDYKIIVGGPGVLPGSNSTTALIYVDTDEIAACMEPKSLHFFSISTRQFKKEHEIKLQSSPLCIASCQTSSLPLIFVGHNAGVYVIRDHKIIQEIPSKFEVYTISVNCACTYLAVAYQDKEVCIYAMDITSTAKPVKTEKPTHQLPLSLICKILSFSPDDDLLMVVANNSTMVSYTTCDFKLKDSWSTYNGTPASLSWAPDGQRFALMTTFGILLIFHSKESFSKQTLDIHRGTGGCFTVWDSENVIYTAGISDIAVKKVKLTI